MNVKFGDRIKNAWNIFMGKDKDETPNILDVSYGASYGYRPDRYRFHRGGEKTIVTSVYSRIGVDVAAINIKHVRTDENGGYISTINSSFNNCLCLEANLDQTGRAFIQDVVMSMLDEGCVAVIPVDTSINPNKSSSYDIMSLRTGKIIDWYPEHIKVELYNEKKGIKENIIISKKTAAIIENPLYAVMNEPNSTMQRLIRKLALLDAVDEQSGSGKLDLIIQLPYVVKTEARKNQAEHRRKAIEDQLSGSKYGIAYTDGTEKITQLNRAVDNNLMKQVEYLTSMLYSQLGITQSILDGTADEATMINYQSRTLEPILSAIVDEFRRKFLTKTARSQMQSVKFFMDPFKLVPLGVLAEIADKLTRNEILSSNEIRRIVGYTPSNDPKADELRNKNIGKNSEEQASEQKDNLEEGENQNG